MVMFCIILKDDAEKQGRYSFVGLGKSHAIWCFKMAAHSHFRDLVK